MTEKADEAPRGFAVLIQQIEDGECHGELSEAVQTMTQKLMDHLEKYGVDAKGSITLTLGFAARRNGTIEVQADVKAKHPKAKRAGSVFWATKGGNLSVDNPRQTRLPLREVPNGAAAPRDVPTDARPARTV